MKINKLVQVGTKTITEQIPILDEEGNETGEFKTIEREIPIMEVVYRNMTPEEVAQAEADAANTPEPEPTPEERIAELEAKLDALTTYQGLTVREIGGGVFEVMKRTSGAGTSQEPYELSFPVNAEPNAFYRYGGKVYVYMGANPKTETELTDDFVEADWL